MPEFVRVELRRTLKCTLILRHIMVLLRIRVNVPLTLTRGPGKHETKKKTDMDILLAAAHNNECRSSRVQQAGSCAHRAAQ